MAILVDEKSKLSKALALHAGVLEYIISLSPHEFVRLRNPLMRRLMPPRISLGRIARMTNTPVVDQLAGIHEVAGQPLSDADRQAISQRLGTAGRAAPTVGDGADPPPWVLAGETIVVDLLESDARLDSDPVVPINRAIKQNPAGTVILIKHKWEPQPLYDVWVKMDVDHHAKQIGEDEWWIYIRKNAPRR